MDKKKIGVLLVIILVLSSVLVIYNKPKELSSHIIIACSVEAYSQREGIGYMRLKLHNPENTIKEIRVEDKELQQQLSQIKLPNIIGVQMLLTIPKKEIELGKLDHADVDVLELLCDTESYDQYFVVTGVSVK